jgi:hypothetical protein
MPVERRERVTAIGAGQPATGGTRCSMEGGSLRCGGTSRMTRECQVRFCERLGVKFPGPTRRVSRVSPVQTAMRNSTRDEGRSFEAGSQVLASNRCKLLSSKAMVVSVAVNVGRISRRVRLREASASEPPVNCRKRIRRCQNRGVTLPPGSARGNPEACPSGIRHVGGAKLNQALVRNVRTCAPMQRERSQAVPNREDQSTEAERRGGAARSRDEGSVMEPDRRGCVVQPRSWANR